MKKSLLLLSLLSFSLVFSSLSFSYFKLDGDETDWAEEPVLITAVDNVDGYFPSEVGAAVTDNVDVKEVKAKISGNVLYYFIRFHGGPVYPNMADKREYEGTAINRSRGYYDLMLDLDNDATTGANSHYYEAHFTPVGYLASQGVPASDAIGAESYVEIGYTGYFTPPHTEMGGVNNSGIKSLGYSAYDVSELNTQTDEGEDYSLMDVSVNKPDSAKAKAWKGTLLVEESDDSTLVNGKCQWMGHAWGTDFLEMGMELSLIQEYWKNKGENYLEEGDVIGISVRVETPADDWGVDMTPRGAFTCPALPVRPSSIKFDGDESDWASKPLLVESVDNVDGYFPSEVGAAVTDNVDVKEVKAFVNDSENTLYWFVRLWGGPAFPNMADKREFEGSAINRSRGYYDILLDLDNDATTGSNSHYYEAHFTPVGYLASQGVPSSDAIGAESYFEVGYTGYFTPPHTEMGGVNNTGIKSLGYSCYDISEIKTETDEGEDFTIYDVGVTDPDSAKAKAHDGMLLNEDSNDESLLNDVLVFNSHAWGADFLEMGQSLALVKQYWMAKKGIEVLKPGDQVGIAVRIETPADDWGVDMSPRGILEVTTGVPSSKNASVANQFRLENNYPNPFNPETSINYYVPQKSEVTIAIFNSLGQKVRTLVNETRPAGNHLVKWNGLNDAGQMVSSGVYIYKLQTNATVITKKMTLLK